MQSENGVSFFRQQPPLHTPFWLHGGHAQTIFPKLVREPQPPYRRELAADSTGDTQVAYDWIDSTQPDTPVVVLFHGLEGSSQSHYARALMNAVKQRGWSGCVAHFRGCGGMPNTAAVAYHCGDSREIGHMLQTVRQKSQRRIFAVGVSLGGNVLARYLAETGSQALCAAAAAVSTPWDLEASGEALERGISRLIYQRYFLSTLLPKVRAEAQHYPQIDLARVLRARTLGEFDDAFTAPVHGFADRIDYYRKTSAKPLLRDISVPTLLLNARNDPFMPAELLPAPRDVSNHVYLWQPFQGGHAGFVDNASGSPNLRWLPERLLQFFEWSQG